MFRIPRECGVRSSNYLPIQSDTSAEHNILSAERERHGQFFLWFFSTHWRAVENGSGRETRRKSDNFQPRSRRTTESVRLRGRLFCQRYTTFSHRICYLYIFKHSQVFDCQFGKYSFLTHQNGRRVQ